MLAAWASSSPLCGALQPVLGGEGGTLPGEHGEHRPSRAAAGGGPAGEESSCCFLLGSGDAI